MTNALNNTAPKQKRRPRPRRDAGRLYVVAGALFIGVTAIIGRLFWLQIMNGEHFAEQARRQYESKVTLQAQRGAVYDRNGNLLATNVAAASFAVDPRSVEEPETLAQRFAEAFGGESADYARKVSLDSTAFVWIRRKVVGEAINRLKGVDDAGLITLSEPLRRFEYGTFGAQVIGCTSLDNSGLSGAELYYNDLLSGEDGYVVMQRDARGRRRPDVDLPRVEPQHGESLQLTIDINLQSIVEDELGRGVKQADASSGTVVALDPNSGEILAMASWPTYDPNDLASADQSAIRARAVTDMYEPGSTMKVITGAAALEEEVVTPEDIIDGEEGEFRLPDGHVIRDDHMLGPVSFRDAFRWSSNIIFAKVADRVDDARFYKYVRDFGFGIASGIDIPGEVRGEVKKPEDFSEETQMFMAYGYQLAVTPLQLAVAYAAIANGGRIMRPHILKARLDKDGEVIEEVEPQEIRRVISTETAATLRDFLTDAVDSGTGRAAQVRGIKVAGKTGTAQQLFEGSYSSGKYNASFVGFFPAEKPQVVLLVLLSEPRNGYYGGQVAAPIFAAITRRVVNATMHESSPEVRMASDVENVDVQTAGTEQKVFAPDLRGLDLESARRVAVASGVRVIPQGEGARVTAQEPGPGSRMNETGIISLKLEPEQTRLKKIPDVRGMTLRRALALLSGLGVEPKVKGQPTGLVRSQWPAPGTTVEKSSGSITLTCR